MNFPLVYLLIYISWIAGCCIRTIHSNTGLLDDSLFTFQDHACEDNKLRIRCPYGTTINIQWAQFGRTQPSQQICPFGSHSLGDSPEEQLEEDTQCLATTTLEIVLEQCQDRRLCGLLASTAVFGQDPCPTTSKYLEIAYRCRPTEFRSRMVCDGEQMQLHCARSQRMAVYSASFGWSQTSQFASECAEYAPYTRDCDSSCAYGYVYSRCHGRKRCTLWALDSSFHSTCDIGTPKYLMVVYTCVPKRILNDINEENDYPDPCDTEDTSAVTPPQNGAPGSEGTEVAGGQGGTDNRDPSNPGERVEPDVEGQPSYLPKPSTIKYDQALTPQPELFPGLQGNHDNPYGEGADQTLGEGGDQTTGEPNTGAVQDGVSGFVSNWLYTWNFLTENTEKFILYVVVGLLFGIISVLLVIIIRLNQLRRRGKNEAKLNISEPIANCTAGQAPETTSLLEPSDQSDGVEMTSYNQIDSMHRPPVSSFTDPYEEETPVNFATTPIARDPHGTFGRNNPTGKEQYTGPLTPNSHAPGYSAVSRPNNHNHGNGASTGGNGNAGTFNTRPNHTRQTSFSGSLGRNTQPGTLTGSLNRRDHWTNEYRNEGHSHTLQHYYG